MKWQGDEMRNPTLMLCLVTGVFGGWAAAQDSASRQDAAFKLIENAVTKGEIPGAVALVAHEGRIVREAAYGLSDIENRVPFTADTVCWLASVTKPVTTAAIMKLVEEGKLRLDDPVEKYIPEFRMQQDKDGRHYAITIRQLLTHTAGLPADPPTRKDVFDPEWRSKSVAETVGPIAQATLQFPPGAKVQYSNAGFYVLGRIIEIASGRPYADYVKEKILDPLGMKESFYPRFLAAVEPRRIASVYRQRQGERFLYFRYEPGMTTRNDTPDGGLFCAARDIFKFCQMFLDNDGRVLAKDSVEQMLREQAPGRGLGWAMENGGFAHAGSSGAYAWGDPNTGLVAVLLIQYNDFRRIPRLHAEFIEAVRTAYRAESKSTSVSLFAPEDGGTPRDMRRIVAVGPVEFRIRACAEEGHSVLTHAVSRVDLVCRNDGAKPQDVTLHLDLSDDGRRTNADTTPSGGMSTRDFIFIQPPGQPWKQVNGSVSGWVCTVRFSAPPGETKVGLSPWYTYGDYLHFVPSLPEHPHLTKTRIGTSAGGREHWELTITDPGVPKEGKKTIFWHTREHAYETFSSYAMEGLIGYLLSNDAAEARRRYRIVLHPMTNVDGVAQGYEYRSGYDYPQPRGTATGKLTFDTIDRLRPDFAVTWHNWVAPRDTDCLFYTDSENGKASRRAWDLFTQRFPSPRGVGHHWESESNPLAKNWFGRTLRESNLHEYAMKRYGTQVWGWEMPWWGRDVDGARKAGADFGRAFLETLAIIRATTLKPSADAASPTPSDTVVLHAPADGGSPRNAANLVRTSVNRYRLRVEQSETHEGVVIGQFMMEAANNAATPQTVTLDLVGAPNRYCYYRTPSGAWRRTEVGANGTSLQLSIPPGVTRIATVPWFTYGEYVAYIDSLTDSRVTKEVAFTDEGGKFKIYRLRVTNPTGVKNKLKICFGKAQHAHETSAFFLTQGIIDWLLSGDSAANLDNIVWTFYPCADPKAAYQHLNYNEVEKEPYDTGKSGHASYYDDIAAGHHHLIQISHMWNNEGHNLEHESYEYWDPQAGSTDLVTWPAVEPDSSLYRDWMAFWPHWFEWGTDTYWHRNGRKWEPLGGGAVMLNEIYYHGKDSGGDVAANLRRQGKEWARAVSQVYLQFQQAKPYWTSAHPCGAVDVTGAVLLPRPVHTLLETLTPVSGSVQVNKNAGGQAMVIFGKQYDHGLGTKGGAGVTYDIPAGVNAFRAVVALDDAQTDNAATAEFVVKLDGRELWRSRPLAKRQSEMVHVGLPGRGQLTLSVEGAGGVLGNWAGAKFTANDPDKTMDGQTRATSVDPPVPARDAGPILIDPDYPHSFRYQNGARFFPMGDTAYYLIGRPKDVIAHYIDVRRQHRFNFIRMMPMAEGHWPFGGSPTKPDYTTIDETAMQKLDWVFDYAAGKGMNIELIVWGYGIAGGEGLWAHPTQQNLWIDTLVQRYKDRPNLLMYTVANEFERYPDGKYSYSAGDVEWAKAVAARIRGVDKVHPVGVHPSHWVTEDTPYLTYGGFTQRRPQVVWPLWEAGSVNLNVTQNNEGVQRRTWGDYGGARRGLTYYPTTWQGVEYPVRWTATGWDFEGAGLEDSMAEDWAHGKPALDTEFGYQYEPGDDSGFAVQTRQVHQPSTVRKKAWKIVTAGGYFAMGFTSTAVIHFSTSDVDNFRPGQLETLYDFLTTRTQYWKMAPHLELVASHNALLALPGREYVAYFPRGGTNSINLAAGTYAVQWLRPETGQYYAQPGITAADGDRPFTPPDDPDADWVLHLRGQ